jgi:hypothetical protein
MSLNIKIVRTVMNKMNGMRDFIIYKPENLVVDCEL